MTEADLLTGVLDLARALKWRTAHFRPAQTARGWRTPVSGDGKGFPDILLVRDRLIAAELKAGSRLTPEQTDWLAALRAVGIETFVWTPADYPDGIAAVLNARTSWH